MTADGAIRGVRAAFAIAGVIGIVVGLLILLWPLKTAAVGTGIIAVYALVAGLVYAFIGVRKSSLRGWSRIGHVFVGLLFVAAGVYALANLAATTAFLALFVAVAIGITWIVEGVVALTTVTTATVGRGWTIFYAVVSLAAGVLLLFAPLYVTLLWLFVGASLLVLGVVQVVRATRFGASRVPAGR
ncbi:DUF308 domain-containing protein [Microbacterium marinilacus]|uniref:HdeD family acid-resistance protein n=1 Tax=Microbacterium marinilacus TaxID=415209 RepID=A0ABP7B4V9_9MICO|nr:DUF308 domain-containing protein [Microbacterium marinilacus]MBY0687895.1 DUF308 domain-containing protein [Microbacterium marinilacus]